MSPEQWAEALERHLRAAASAIEESDHPDELLDEMCRKAAAPAARGGGWAPGAREAVVFALGELCERRRLPKSALFRALALLSVCRDSGLGSDMEAMPQLCVTIFALVLKADRQCDARDREEIQRAEEWLSERLRALRPGMATSATSVPARSTEHRVLRAIGWRLFVPTVFDFLGAFCGRLDAATHGSLKESVEWTFEQAVGIAHHLSFRTDWLEKAPRACATGLLAHGLVAAGVLPDTALVVEASDQPKRWEAALAAVPWPRAAAGCRLWPRQRSYVAGCVRLAAAAGRRELEDAVLFVGALAGAGGEPRA